MASPKENTLITLEMTLLDIISRHRETEAVFKKYDAQTGVCLCCHALFDPLRTVIEKYNLDRDQLLSDLASAASDHTVSRDSIMKECDGDPPVDGGRTPE